MSACIRAMVRKQIADAIADDLEGGESLMKEVYENLPGKTDAEYKVSMSICKDEMRSIITWLRTEQWNSEAQA